MHIARKVIIFFRLIQNIENYIIAGDLLASEARSFSALSLVAEVLGGITEIHNTILDLNTQFTESLDHFREIGYVEFAIIVMEIPVAGTFSINGRLIVGPMSRFSNSVNGDVDLCVGFRYGDRRIPAGHAP